MSSLIDVMEQVKSLRNGVGIQSLLDSAYRILGNPILMHDTEYKLIAHTEAVAVDDPIWNEFITHGTVSRETQEFFVNEGFIESMTNAKRITFMRSSKLKYDRIAGKVFNGNNSYVANLIIVACNKSFTSYDPEAFESICKLITREISKSEFYQVYEKIHQETIIKNLIDGNFDSELDMGQIEIIYENLKANLYLAVVDISECDPDYTRLVYFRDLFKQIHPAYKYAIYSNYILIIISTNNKNLNVNEELNKLNKLFEQNGVYAGISSQFENLFELHKYYEEALKALKYVLKSKGTQRIFPYDIDSINTMEKILALKNGMGVQGLLNEAFKIFGNPVLMHGMELRFLACTENVTVDDPIWEEFLTYGVISDETIEFFENEGFSDAVANTQTVTLLTSEKLSYDRISGIIFNRDNIIVGCLVIVASHKPFGNDEIALFNSFCEILSKEVSGSEFYNNYGQACSESLVSKLIDGKINDYALFSQNIINIFNDLRDNLYLVVVDITKCNPEHTKIEYYRDMFKQLQTVNRYAIYSNYILIIISTDNTSHSVEKELNKVSELFEQNNICAGISSRFGNVYELQKHYAEAVNMLNNGLKDIRQEGN